MEMLNGPNINDSAEQIFDMLDLNDTELDIQHDEFHKRITDLQNKKFQIDQFLAQLQNSGANGEDVGKLNKKKMYCPNRSTPNYKTA